MTPMDQGEFVLKFKSAPGASIAETRGRLERGAQGPRRVQGGQLHLRLHRRGRRRHRARRDGVREAGAARTSATSACGRSSTTCASGSSGSRASCCPSRKTPTPCRSRCRWPSRATTSPRSSSTPQAVKRELYTVPGIVDIEAQMEHDLPEYRLDRGPRARGGLGPRQRRRSPARSASLVGGQAVSTYEDEEGEAVDVRVRLPQELRGDVRQVGDLKMTVPTAAGAGAGAARRPGDVHARDVARGDQPPRPDAPGDASTPTSTTCRSARPARWRWRRRARVQMAAGLQARAGRRHRDDGRVVRLHGRGAAARHHLRLPDPRGAVRVVHRPAGDHARRCRCRSSAWRACCALTGDTINIMSLIGLIMLMGLVTKNAILLVDYTKVLRGRGMDRRTALITAGPDAAAARS